ncbi:MAG: hypothetical protein AAF433_15270 [Bacteroidota bacterium]
MDFKFILILAIVIGAIKLLFWGWVIFSFLRSGFSGWSYRKTPVNHFSNDFYAVDVQQLLAFQQAMLALETQVHQQTGFHGMDRHFTDLDQLIQQLTKGANGQSIKLSAAQRNAMMRKYTKIASTMRDAGRLRAMSSDITRGQIGSIAASVGINPSSF